MTTSTQAGAQQSPGRLVGNAAHQCISRLQYGYGCDVPAAVSALARLRRGAGHPAHDLPDLWGLAGTDELAELLTDVEGEKRKQIDDDRADEALHIAVTLWALHQQSHRDANMHAPGLGLGRAVRLLMSKSSTSQNTRDGTDLESSADGKAKGQEELNDGLRKRFVRVGTASSLTVLAQRLREIVLLLRRAGISLDYGLLASQLYSWQHPAGRADVRRAWGRDFHLAGVRSTKKTS